MDNVRKRALGPCILLGVVLGAASAWGQSQAESPDASPPAGQPGSGPGSVASPASMPVIQQMTGIDLAEDQGMPWSQGISFEDRRAARDLFLQANELAQSRFLATSVNKYKEALAMWPHPAFHYNLAVVQMGLNDPVSAYKSLQKALEYGSDGLGSDKHAEARQYQTFLSEQLARVVIVCDEPDAQVTLDGKPLFTGPGQYTDVIRPGAYEIEAAKNGLISDVRRVILPAGKEQRLELVLKYSSLERRWSAWVPWSAVGLGVALAVGGGVFHAQAASAFDDHDSAVARQCEEGCAPAELSSDEAAELERLRDRGESRRTLAAVAYGVGGAALASGVVLLYLNRERRVTREVRGKDGGGSGVAVIPVVSSEVMGVSTLLRF